MISNLKVNYEKSIITPFRINTDVNALNLGRPFNASKARFTYLGLQIYMKPSFGAQANFHQAPIQIKTALARTPNYTISVLGHILPSKALGISKLTYKLSYLSAQPTVLDKIIKTLINAIWLNGRHKVSQSKLYSKHEHAGFNMINLHWYDMSLKMSMLNRAFLNPDEFWTQHLHTCLRVPLKDKLTSNLHPAQIKMLVYSHIPGFWLACLLRWAQFHYVDKKSNANINAIAFIRLQYYAQSRFS